MQGRKFSVGDQVRLLFDSSANANSADVYTVTRTLPENANVWQYRVRRGGDGQERAASEQQLAKATFRTSADRPLAEAQHETQRMRNTRASGRARMTEIRFEQERR
jgi:hypothetical protein